MVRELRNEEVWRQCGFECLPSRWTLSRFITDFALVAENIFITLVHELAEQVPLGKLFRIATHGGDTLTATTTYEDVLDTEITFLALPTPSREDGSIDTSIIEAAAETLGETLQDKDGNHTVVTKSTVIPTTTSETLAPILEATSGKTLNDDLHVAMNPISSGKEPLSKTSSIRTRSSSAPRVTRHAKHSMPSSSRSLRKPARRSSKRVSRRRR